MRDLQVIYDYMDSKDQNIFYNIKYNSDNSKIYKAFQNNEKIDEKELSEINYILKKEGIKAFISQELNNKLYYKGQFKKNLIFYLKGNIELLEKQTIILSADELNSSCINQIDKIIRLVKNNYIFILLLFKGIDNHVLEKLNRLNQSYIIVLPNGIINNPILKEIDCKKNLLISEYLYNTNISKNKLRRRNLVAANLCQNQIIFNSKIDSKIIHLTNLLLDLGKEIYCFLNKNDEGNHNLIIDGAQIIY